MKRPSIIATDKGGGDFTPVPAGVHLAMCNAVIDLGLQESTGQYAGKVQRRVHLRFEIPDERVERDGRDIGPAVIGIDLTLSTNEKSKMRKLLEAWRGRVFTDEEIAAFDVTTVLGKLCQLQVIHDTSKPGKTYANISTIMGLSKHQREEFKAKPMQAENQLIVYSPEDHDPEAWGLVPEYLQKKIAARVRATANDSEMDGAPTGKPSDYAPDSDPDDDIPF